MTATVPTQGDGPDMALLLNGEPTRPVDAGGSDDEGWKLVAATIAGEDVQVRLVFSHAGVTGAVMFSPEDPEATENLSPVDDQPEHGLAFTGTWGGEDVRFRIVREDRLEDDGLRADGGREEDDAWYCDECDERLATDADHGFVCLDCGEPRRGPTRDDELRTDGGTTPADELTPTDIRDRVAPEELGDTELLDEHRDLQHITLHRRSVLREKPDLEDAIYNRIADIWSELESRADPDYPSCRCGASDFSQTPGEPVTCNECHRQQPGEIEEAVHDAWKDIWSLRDTSDLRADGGRPARAVGLSLEPLEALATAESGHVILNVDTPDEIAPTGVDVEPSLRLPEVTGGEVHLEAHVGAVDDDTTLSVGMSTKLDADQADDLADALREAAELARDQRGDAS